MKTYNVQKTVQTEKNTTSFNKGAFDNLQDAEKLFDEILKQQQTYAGEYNDINFSEYYTESLELICLDDDEDDIEPIKEVVVYHEGTFDKNNYKSDYADNYWGVGKFNGTELVYNFKIEGKIEYTDIKESELKNWYRYSR